MDTRTRPNVSVPTSPIRTVAPTVASGKEDVLDLVPVMKVYPNPAKDKLTVEFMSGNGGKTSLNIYNMTGQKVMSIVSSATEGLNTQTVNTNTLSTGAYVFEVENNGEIQRMKFTVEK